MDYKTAFIIFAFFSAFAFSFMIISSKDTFSVSLAEGKNQIRINLSEPVYAETLIKMNPGIEAISFTEENRTVGYVNVFQGVGKNFAVTDREYEIIASKSMDLVLPS
ncbi:hypothetical protein A3K73_05480 [Candidatus Pacearchaeota archaeon RBG_13_36_9]|nr:MAG: hypothetical protein A3K73_05480 [Candidatus Pacearchaeota archaeon RBG_13_36_9]